ncbi:phosphotransferase [Microbacterium sp. ASV49]|uniref:Phosphotransferase n=1 Tax=Microbacterium candidum TaxID=3041922 RepID=A0ABT7N000_9MICO|nr:phosphotransferase [Microbacterium sp. ASV49]MDL9980033.1 phosphotransferase [Microbacterium sp. ASV49]
MAGRPAAETPIDAHLVRALVRTIEGIPDAADLPIAHVADGWDCSIWRLGDDLAVRLPRRAEVAALLDGESRSLAAVAPAVEATGVRVPAVVATGAPAAGYPWTWTVVPFFAGTSGIHVSRERRRGWAARLAAAFGALHSPAPEWHPRNPYRGVPFADRAEVVATRLEACAERVGPDQHAALVAAWEAGLAAPAWEGAPVWIHGDAHPANLIARDDELVAIIDFVDITAGDAAYDLAAAWLVFDGPGRRAFMNASPHVDADTWVRGRAWAAAITALLVAGSDDNLDYERLARESLTELTGRAARLRS